MYIVIISVLHLVCQCSLRKSLAMSLYSIILGTVDVRMYMSILGKCYVVSSQKSLVQCMENLTQKLHPGVVVNFQKVGGVSPTPPPDVIPMEVNSECSYTNSFALSSL